jgi:hypothetical protein
MPRGDDTIVKNHRLTYSGRDSLEREAGGCADQALWYQQCYPV